MLILRFINRRVKFDLNIARADMLRIGIAGYGIGRAPRHFAGLYRDSFGSCSEP